MQNNNTVFIASLCLDLVVTLLLNERRRTIHSPGFAVLVQEFSEKLSNKKPKDKPASVGDPLVRSTFSQSAPINTCIFYLIKRWRMRVYQVGVLDHRWSRVQEMVDEERNRVEVRPCLSPHQFSSTSGAVPCKVRC